LTSVACGVAGYKFEIVANRLATPAPLRPMATESQVRASVLKNRRREIMRNLFFIVMTLALLAIAGGGTSACAQVMDSIEADVPFDFTVRNQVMPAGHYIIKRLDDSRPGVMTIRGSDSHEARIFLTGDAQIAKEPRHNELIFDRVGDQYFLSRIFEVGNEYGVAVKKSRSERKLETEGAMLERQTVAVPARVSINAKN
jgi:hypothetical protein